MTIAKLTQDDLRENGRENTQLAKLNELATAVNSSALAADLDALEASSVARLVSVGPVAAKSATDVHALYDDTTAAFPGPFTDPDVPRNLRVTMSAGWDGGSVTVSGTDQFDASISEVFATGDGVVRVGVKVFKTVTGAVKGTPAGVTGNGASIGTGDTVGLPMALSDEVGLGFVTATPEAITLDDTYSSFVPATTPSATTYLVLANFVMTE